MILQAVDRQKTIAIISQEKNALRDLMTVDDEKSLTVWTDQDTKWCRFKSDSFLKHCYLGGSEPCEDGDKVMPLNSAGGQEERQGKERAFTGSVVSTGNALSFSSPCVPIKTF